MSIFLGIILFLIPSAFGGVLIMRVFARNFLYHKPFWNGIAPTLIVTLFLLIVSTIIVYRITKPFDTVLKRLKAGGEKPSYEEKLKCLSSYKSIRLLIFIVHFFGFLGGQVGVALLDVALGKSIFNLLYILVLSFHSLAIAGVFSLITLYGFDQLICAPAREVLEIRTVKEYEKYKHPKVITSINVIFYFVIAFFVMNLVFVTIGMVGDPEFMKTISPVSYYLKSITISFLISLIVGGFPFIIYIRGLNLRIKDTSNLLDSTAERGDLASRINITTIDDFGRLVGSINTLMSMLSEMVVSLKSGTGVVSNSATTLTDVSSTALQALEQMKSALQQIQNNASAQNEVITVANSDVDTLIEKVEAVQKHILDQSASVQQGSAAISEMIANIASVADMTKKADIVSEELSNSSIIGNQSIANAMDTIDQIQKYSGEMQDIISVIEQIATQTNLLSMNAAIEAAHAGDFGKGFAVVADEVRTLAASSGESAQNIHNHINNMIETINNSVQAMNRAKGAFSDIAEQVKQNHELTRTIAAAMEEQRTGAEETLKTTTTVVDSMEAIKQLAAEEAERAKSVQSVMKNVVESSNSSMELVSNCVGVSNQLETALGEVETSIKENEQAVANMSEKINVFKI